MRDTQGLHFTLDEYSARIARVQGQMRARGIDLLVLSDPCNLYYLSGYDAWSFYVQQALLVPASGERLVWIGREMDVGCARRTSCLEEADIEAYGDSMVQSASSHPMSHVAAIVRARGWERACIGMELGSYYLGAQAYEVLRRELPNTAFVDASLLVNWVRVVKSDAELRYMREGARIVERAMQVAMELVRPGARQCDVAAAIYHALISGTADYGGQYTSTPPLMPSGARVDTPHLTWTSERYLPDSLTNFELVAARHRYHTPLARSIYLGTPPQTARTLEAALFDGNEAVLSTLRPGMTASDVERLWQQAAGRHGVQKRARCGYSIGIAYPPTFGEQTVSLRPADETVLQENMTLHLMPGVWQDGASLVMTEPLVVTRTGCEALCRFERRLFVRE